MSDSDTTAEDEAELERLYARRLALATRFYSDLLAYYAAVNAAMLRAGGHPIQVPPDVLAQAAVHHAEALLKELDP